MDDDAVYFERRASEEMLAAAKAEHPKAREAHLAMARCYQQLVGLRPIR